MRRTQSVVNLDPIDRKNRKNPGLIGRMLMTRHFKGVCLRLQRNGTFCVL